MLLKKIDLEGKQLTFINATDCKETVQLVLITPHGVKDNEYSSVIQNQVKMTDLFYEWL